MASHVPVEERRPQLIEGAIRVIAREGVARATTRRIADEAGSSLASLHYSFRDKEELLASVTEHVVARTEEALAARAAPSGSGLRGAVADLLVFFHDWTVADPGLQAAQFELMAWAQRTPRRSGLADRCYVLYGRALVTFLRRAGGPGPAEAELERLATLTMAATDGVALRVLASGPDVWAGTDWSRLAGGLVATAE